MAYIDDKKTDEVQDKIVEWLNDNLIDPYEQATGKSRSTFVSADNMVNSQIFPIVQIAGSDIEPTKVTAKKTGYLEEVEHNFIIFYKNQKARKFTFENGKVLQDDRQCRRYLEYIHDKLKENADEFGEYFHKMTFGSISQPVFDNNTSIWRGMLPLIVYTYKR